MLSIGCFFFVVFSFYKWLILPHSASAWRNDSFNRKAQCVNIKYAIFYFLFSRNIKKSFADKEEGYLAAPNGLRQGNGAGPSVWSIVSSKMFQVMHSRGSVTKITSAFTNETTEVYGFAWSWDGIMDNIYRQYRDILHTRLLIPRPS